MRVTAPNRMTATNVCQDDTRTICLWPNVARGSCRLCKDTKSKVMSSTVLHLVLWTRGRGEQETIDRTTPCLEPPLCPSWSSAVR